ncbi:Insecticidal toxin complex protein TcaC [Moritella sp. PE36]|uniref:SpvB/TcaC N-terminal domain-containing protein n=1 Tax=Moritella sp. PE36 TaxID=58051 RepID=UPI000156900C|nr:SpvB/TcaC N-terminal domain-containing protein [Moritella sp. PE36]EDM66214.1 Insecticidal toxin complex protein TcaC [Moritella sp. PE36]
MQSTDKVQLQTPSLPKGGGTINGMGETLTAGGPTGMASLSIPLPISAGRGNAPALGLSYSSSGGNSHFGIGWQCGTMSISLRTSKGVPNYAGEDTFLGPSGEVLNAVVNNKVPIQEVKNVLQGSDLGSDWQVSRYQPRIIGDFSQLEYWEPKSTSNNADNKAVDESPCQPFWVLYTANGEVHLFGKNSQARVANPDKPEQIAQWLLEESVTPSGEHIYYQYKEEDDNGCDQVEIDKLSSSSAQRYLKQVNYGNITSSPAFFSLSAAPDDDQWLFHLVFDYGASSSSINDVPEFYPNATNWMVRPDCFSRFEYGFEIRTRRLCQQVLMYHRLQALSAGSVNVSLADEVPALVSRLILTYDLNSRASTLTSARQLAHENGKKPAQLPPLELDYQRLDRDHAHDIPSGAWEEMPQLKKLNQYQPYQLVDLYGEGLPGILYQDGPDAWWYRAPIRGDGDANAVDYDVMTCLPQIPALQGSASLLDFNGDGKLDWLITSAGVNGFHSMASDGQWSSFIPLSTLPTEYFHPQAQLADLTGSGLADLVMIGPRSVRLYANERTGWAQSHIVEQLAGITLPIWGRDERRLVVFADLLGSGQQHLADISATEVTCWPNLGNGHFGQPVKLPGFSPETDMFNPEQVYLADIDGSGTTDIIYAHSTRLELFINNSGNKFSESVTIALPDGVIFDNTCQLQIADTQGLGVSSCILTVPHMEPRHWRLDFATDKPWLLNTVNNNMGKETSLFYRSSAQFWLDDKKKAKESGNTLSSHLPFSIHLLWRTEVLDEITCNKLTSRQQYAHGCWDGKEREFRGFGRVTQTDTDTFAQGVGGEMPTQHPAREVSWFATGIEDIDKQFHLEYWNEDSDAYPIFTHRYTEFDDTTGIDNEILLTDQQTYWLQRALKGQLLRNEVYGEDGTTKSPYSVSDHRIQVRMIEGAATDEPFAWVSEIESRSYLYERIKNDPQCSQQILLASDAWGIPIDSVSIAYPRRASADQSLYPTSITENQFNSSCDEQQQMLRLTRQRQSVHHFTDIHEFILGVPDIARSDVWEYEQAIAKDFDLEDFLDNGGSFSLITSSDTSYSGHQRTQYLPMEQGIENATFPPFVAYIETAELTEQDLTVFKDKLDLDDLNKTLEDAGYIPVVVPSFSTDTGADSQHQEHTVWAARRGYTEYHDVDQFYRVKNQQSSLLTGKTEITWDAHYCAVTKVTDAIGLTVNAKYDYRFLAPYEINDTQNNNHYATFDALGRVTSARFSGTENGVKTGYSSKDFEVPTSIDTALILVPGIPVASFQVSIPDSWMYRVTDAQLKEVGDSMTWSALRDANAVTEDCYVCALAYRRWIERNDIQESLQNTLSDLFSQTPRIPPHGLGVVTDRYDKDPEQQLRQTIQMSDGFGRSLQTAVRFENGDSWVRQDDGSLEVVEGKTPTVKPSEFRWAVSGRTEYNSKGLPIRSYQPYFLNDWNYVSDDSARGDLYSDTHCYDPLGREYQVITAKGFLRRSTVTPWFVVSEDENDTYLDSGHSLGR